MTIYSATAVMISGEGTLFETVGTQLADSFFLCGDLSNSFASFDFCSDCLL